jgi:rubrerythrin
MAEYLEKEAFKLWAKHFLTNSSTLLDVIDRTTPADVEPVIHGHWIYECSLPSASEIGEALLWKCSVCGYISFNISTKYCPNCGAKMDEDTKC